MNIQFIGTTGAHYYAVFNDGGDVPQFFNVLTAAYEAYSSANWTATKYCVAAVESSPGLFTVTLPTGVGGGSYEKYVRYLRAGSNPATSDTAIGSFLTLDPLDYTRMATLIGNMANSINTNIEAVSEAVSAIVIPTPIEVVQST